MLGDETLMRFAARVVLEANEREVAEPIVGDVAVDVVKLKPLRRAAHAAALTVASDDPSAQAGDDPRPGTPRHTPA